MEREATIKYLSIDLPTKKDHAYIVPFSCLHVGHYLFDEQKFLGYREWVLKHDNAFCFLNGDLTESAIIGSKGDPYIATMTVSEAKKKIKELFMPLVEADRILGMDSGNHENRIYEKTGNDISLDIAMFLGLEDVYNKQGLCGTIHLGDVKYSFYIKHGKGGGKTQAYKMRKMKEMSNVIKNCDMYIMAHIHDILAFQIKPKFIDVDTDAKYDIKQTFASSSSFMEYGDYAEDGDYEPAKTGSPRIRLDATKKDIHVSI